MRLASASRGLLIHLFGLYKKRLNRGQGHCVFKSIQVQKQLFVMVAHLDALQVAPPLPRSRALGRSSNSDHFGVL